MNTLLACSAGNPLLLVSFLFTTVWPFLMVGLIGLIGLLIAAFVEVANGERKPGRPSVPR